MKRDSHFSGVVAGDRGISSTGPISSSSPVGISGTLIPTSQELVITGTVTPGVQAVELNDAVVIVAATLAAPVEGLLVVKDTSAAGTIAHTLTLTAGTFDGTNNVATLNAPNECLVVYIDSAGDGTIIANVGAVVLS